MQGNWSVGLRLEAEGIIKTDCLHRQADGQTDKQIED